MCLFYDPISNFALVSQMLQYLSRESEKKIKNWRITTVSLGLVGTKKIYYCICVYFISPYQILHSRRKCFSICHVNPKKKIKNWRITTVSLGLVGTKNL